MSKLSFLLIALMICLAAVSVAGAQEGVRVKCDRYTMNVPSINARCYQIDENIPVGQDMVPADPDAEEVIMADISPEELAKAQIACTAIYFSDYDLLKSEIAPQVTFYRVDDLGRTSFSLMDTGLRIFDIVNNINAGFTSADNVLDELPFLPYQAAAKTVNVLPEKLDFENGSGIRTVTSFRDTLFSGAGNSNLYYSFQGITADGNTYVSAVFPLESAVLNGRTAAGIDWSSVSSSDFRPGLDELDFYIRSIVIE